MTNSLSNIVNNLSEERQRTKCKLGHDNKKRETCKSKCKSCDYFLNTKILKMI